MHWTGFAGMKPWAGRATCTGMALVGEDEDRGKTIEVPNERGFLRVQLIANDVAQTFRVWQAIVRSH